MSGYNGWSNRETWLVNLWFGHNWETVEDVQMCQEYIDDEIANLPTWIQDFIDHSAIDWDELNNSVETVEQ